VVERMFKITSLGKKLAGRIQTENRNDVLDFLYKSPGRCATTSELEAGTGLRGGMLMKELNQLGKRGYVKELSHAGV